MLLIHCPYCGPRPELEFAYAGQAHVARHASQRDVGHVGEFRAAHRIGIALHRLGDEHGDDAGDDAGDDDGDDRLDQCRGQLTTIQADCPIQLKSEI